MPTNVVRTKRDEKLWSRAKELAAEQGHSGDYAYITGIYKRMKQEKSRFSDLKTILRKSEGEKQKPAVQEAIYGYYTLTPKQQKLVNTQIRRWGKARKNNEKLELDFKNDV